MQKIFSQGLALAVLAGLTNCAYAAPATYNLDEMVVTASRMELNLKELPQSAEIITKDEIKAIGATNLREALRVSPSILVSEAAGNASVVKMRGSSDYLVLLNGRRTTEDRGLMDDYRMDRFDAQNIERIEILRGPSAALYGSDAMTGVINIITKAPTEEGAAVGVTTGTREMSNYYRFNTGAMGKLSAALAANFTKVRPFAWDDASKTKADGPKQSFNLDMRYAMDEDNELSLFAEYENEDLRAYIYPSTSMELKPGPDGKPHMEMVKVPGRYSDSDMERKSATLGYKGRAAKSNYSVDLTFSNLDTGSERDFWNVDVRNTVRSTDEFTLTYGAEYSKDDGKVAINHVPTDKSAEQWAGYVYGEYRLNDKLLVIPSVRYDHHDSFGGETSPSIGLTYFVDDSSRIKASYGEAYKAPTNEQLYKSWEGGGSGPMDFTLIGNPNLKPETSKGFEIAFEKEFDDRTSAKVAYYNRDKKDAIVMDQSHVMTEDWVQMVNVEKAEFKGVEFALNHDLGNGFTASFNYEYLDAEKTETAKDMFGKLVLGRLPYTARNTYTARLQWVEPKEQEWSVTMWNQWFSDYWANDKSIGKKGAYVNKSINTFNIVVNKSWEDNKYNAFVGVDNVFDKKSDPLRYSGIVWRCGAEVRF